MVLDRGAVLLQRQGGPGDQPERRIGAEHPAFRVTDVRQQRPEHPVGQRLQGRAQRGLDGRLAALAQSREVGLDGAADRGDVRLDHVGRTQVDQPDLAPARGRDDPRGIVRRAPSLLGPLGLEVEDVEPRDLDQDGVGGQGPADLLGRDPRVIAGGPAEVLAHLLGQLPLLRGESVELLAAFLLLAGLGAGQGQGGQLLPHGRQPGGGGVVAVAGQQRALGQRLLGHRLAVEHPAGRAAHRLGVVAPRQGQREGPVELALIVGLEEGELLGLGQGGQDAGDVAADAAALAVDGLGRLGPAPLGGGQDRQVVQAGGHVGVVAPSCFSPIARLRR